jgi:hypothetical protein
MTDLTATYSPEDNKLRLYASSKLDDETYARVKGAGFKWAPKQQLFVAPMWTPSRHDLLIELCGEVGDEDTSLVDRAEQRAERFEDRSEGHAAEAERAHTAAKGIADNIPFGQPILVGHHSERRHRKDIERIQNGFRKAFNMWESSQYWRDRAAGALAHAKYKERPDVRARRIKTIEADRRKQQRRLDEAMQALTCWSKEGLTEKEALALACHTHLGLPRKEGDNEEFHGSPTAYDALSNSSPSLYAPRTLAEVIDAAQKHYPKVIAWATRWIDHYDNRLAYERAMLDEQGGLVAEKVDLQPGGRVLVRGEWLTILRVNKRGGTTNSVTTNCRFVPVRTLDEIKEYQAPTPEVAAATAAAMAIPPAANYPRDDFVQLTKAEYADKPSDYRGFKTIAADDTHGAHRVKYVFGSFLTPEQRRNGPAHQSYFVFITDDKRKDPPPRTAAQPVLQQ